MAAGVLVMAIYREKRFAITCNIALCCGCPWFSNSTSPGKSVVRRRKPTRLPVCTRHELVETRIASALTFM
jgi:hypothetical protein